MLTEFREVGASVVKAMEGQDVFSHSFQHKCRTVTMAGSKAVEIDSERYIDPSFLFQRLIVVVETSEISSTGI